MGNFKLETTHFTVIRGKTVRILHFGHLLENSPLQEAYPHNKSVGWRMEKCIEANPFVGATGTVAELLWEVTPVHCCIELCWIGGKIWQLSIKDDLFPSQFSNDQICKYSGQLVQLVSFWVQDGT